MAPRGFTLVELVIVILILGILAGVAAPKMFQVSSQSTATTTLSNVRVIFDAAEIFKARNGTVPRTADPGDFPSDFDGYLPESVFTEQHELGGYLAWKGRGTGESEYGVVLTPNGTLANWSEFYDLLEQYDDGVTTSGWIKYVGGAIRFRLSDQSADDVLPTVP